jgi:hypothetical protein
MANQQAFVNITDRNLNWLPWKITGKTILLEKLRKLLSGIPRQKKYTSMLCTYTNLRWLAVYKEQHTYICSNIEILNSIITRHINVAVTK